MERRWGLAIVVLGALAAAALAQSQPVVTLPLKPPPQKETKQEAPPKLAAPKPAAPKPVEHTAAVATKPAVPLAPQALFTIPPPAFTTEPLFPPGLQLDLDSLPAPEIERTLLEAKEAPVAEPPMPRPKPALSGQDEATPLRRGPMEPIGDDRPGARSSVVIDQSALDRTLLPAKQKPAAQPPLPRAKPAAAAPKVETALTASDEEPPLRRGEMLPIDDYRPAKLAKPAKTPLPQAKPAAPKANAHKKPLPDGKMKPIDDIPGGKLYVAAADKAPVFRCFVRDVMAFYDRTHIRCYNKARGKLNFFAVDTNQPVAATLLEKGFAAMQSGKPVTITFAPGADLNPSNCDRANCRRLIDIRD